MPALCQDLCKALRYMAKDNDHPPKFTPWVRRDKQAIIIQNRCNKGKYRILWVACKMRV